MLTSERVEEVFLDCLFEDGEDTTEYILAEGISSKVGFNPKKLNKYRNEIVKMLDDLPNSFKEKFGGGMSFLQACEDKNGRQWTDSHQRMEQLFQLGIAIRCVESLLPRDLWKMLPGTMPYYMIKEDDQKAGQGII